MTPRHHGQYARHAVPAPLLAPASRAGRDLEACKQSPENVEKRRKAAIGLFKVGRMTMTEPELLALAARKAGFTFSDGFAG